MIAFRVRLNGEIISTAGQDDMSILSTTLTASRGNQERDIHDYLRLSVGGLSHPTEKGYPEHFRWQGRSLDIGDKIEVEILDTDTFDTPKKRFRSDHEVQENPFTEDELRDMRYDDYLNLKEEFEPKSTAR